jgi:hypothetical protein
MPPVKTLMTAGAVLFLLILSAAAANAAATSSWSNGNGTVHGSADVDQAARALVAAADSAGTDRAARPPGSAAAAACHWQVGYAAADQLTQDRPEAVSRVDVERVEADGSRSRLYARVCDDRIVLWQWLRVPDVADALAAAEQDVRRRLPAPRGRFSPDVTAGAVVVRVPVWFAVPGQWSAVSASAGIPGGSVTVTATATVLRFDPGDGSPPVSCAGPGPVFVPGTPEPVRPPACSYAFLNASTAAPGGRSWPGALSVDWTVTWTASDGEHGELASVTTRADVPVEVREIEAVERAGR